MTAAERACLVVAVYELLDPAAADIPERARECEDDYYDDEQRVVVAEARSVGVAHVGDIGGEGSRRGG